MKNMKRFEAKLNCVQEILGFEFFFKPLMSVISAIEAIY